MKVRIWTQRLHSGDIPLEEGPPFWCQHAGALGEGIVWEFLSNSVAKLDTWRWKYFLMHLFVSHSRNHFQKVISSMFLPSVKNWFGKIWSRWDMLSSQLCKFLHCLTPKAPSRAPCFFCRGVVRLCRSVWLEIICPMWSSHGKVECFRPFQSFCCQSTQTCVTMRKW